MDALPPSLPNAAAPQPVPAGMAGLAILLAELSQSLAQLPAGTQIPALVTQILPQPQTPQPAADPSAPKSPTLPSIMLQISTPQGPAQIRIPAAVQIPIPVGAKLEIAVSAAGPQPQWRLTAIDGKPVPVATQAAPPPISAPVATVAPIFTAPRPTAAPGIPATLVKSADPALPSGTILLVRITNLIPAPQPQPQPQQVQTQTQPQAPAPESEPLTEAEPEETPPITTPAAQTSPPTATAAIIPSATSIPVTTATATAPLPTSVPQPVETVTVAPTPTAAPMATTAPIPAPILPVPNPTAVPATPSPPTATQAPAPSPPTEIGGEVLPNTDAGRPLINTPVGLLALTVDPQSAPPTGAHITLTVIGKPVPPDAPILPPPPDDPPDKALPRRLRDLVEQVQTSGNDKLAEAVRQAIPAPGPKLAAQLLSVIASAEPSQGLPRLFGEGLASALTHAAPEAMAQLSRQWEAISQPVQGPDAGDWRMLMLPLMMGGQMNLIRLTTRQQRRGVSPADREKGTRFLLDLDLSRMGPMQFDGLVKRQHKHFDLIIRTKEPLSGEMRRDIDGLFVNGLMNFGLQGSILFQPEGRFVATQPLTGDTSGIIFA